MATKRKAHGKKKSGTQEPNLFLTICADCKIRLVVSKEKANACDLCKSPNISKETWR